MTEYGSSTMNKLICMIAKNEFSEMTEEIILCIIRYLTPEFIEESWIDNRKEKALILRDFYNVKLIELENNSRGSVRGKQQCQV